MVLVLLFAVLAAGAVLSGRVDVIARHNGPPVYFLGKQMLTFAPSALPAPRTSESVVHVEGHRSNGTFIVKAWRTSRKEQRAGSGRLLHSSTATVRVVLVNIGSSTVPCTQDQVASVFTRSWGVRDFFGAMASVGGGVSNLQLESVVSVTLSGSYPPTLDGSYSVCSTLVNDVFAQLPPSQSHSLLLLSAADTDCGIGASPVGCFPCYSVVWMLPNCGSLGLVLHELMHSFGLHHSNLKMPDRPVVPYGDGSCAMGLSLADPGLARRGVSVPQLFNLGVVSSAQVADGSSGGVFVIATGYYNSTAALKMVQVGSLLVSFRQDDATGIDNNANVTVAGSQASFLNPAGFPSFSNVVFVHEQDPSGTVNLINVLREGESVPLTAGLVLYFLSFNDTHASVAISSSGPPLVPPLSSKSMRRVVPLANSAFSGIDFTVDSSDTALLFDGLSVASAVLYVDVSGGGYVDTMTVNGVVHNFGRVLFDREQLAFPVDKASITVSASPAVKLFSGTQCGYNGWDGAFQCGPRLRVLESAPSDLNRDGHVDVLDFLLLVQQLGCVDCAGDLDGSGSVDAGDMTWLLDYWTG